MTNLVATFLATGRLPSLEDKIAAETDVEDLNHLQRGASARRELTVAEIQAFARRRAEIRKGAR